MIVPYTICGEDVEVTLEEYLDGEEWFCDDCCKEALIFIREIYSKVNLN